LATSQAGLGFRVRVDTSLTTMGGCLLQSQQESCSLRKELCVPCFTVCITHTAVIAVHGSLVCTCALQWKGMRKAKGKGQGKGQGKGKDKGEGEHLKMRGQYGHRLLAALSLGGWPISSRLITFLAPCRTLVPMQSVPVSPPPITTTFLSCITHTG
jgi:hypothetical protein